MLNKYLNERTNLNSTKEAWEFVWFKQRARASDIIDIGRRIYNYFLFKFLKKYINNLTEFLEFGCGTATLGVKLAPEVKSYTGYDIAENALKEARENFRKNRLKNFSFE